MFVIHRGHGVGGLAASPYVDVSGPPYSSVSLEARISESHMFDDPSTYPNTLLVPQNTWMPGSTGVRQVAGF